jgi:hypothetical protein
VISAVRGGEMDSRFRRNDGELGNDGGNIVIPAKAGIHLAAVRSA